MDFGLDDFTNELGAIWSTIATPLSWFCGILIIALVALRGFYIQKQHERMADKYEEVLRAMWKVYLHIVVTRKGKQPVDDRLVFVRHLEAANFVALTAPIYLSPAATEILSEYIGFIAELQSLMPVGPEKADAVLDTQAIIHQRCLMRLAQQAKQDLRPSLILFLLRFVFA